MLTCLGFRAFDLYIIAYFSGAADWRIDPCFKVESGGMLESGIILWY